MSLTSEMVEILQADYSLSAMLGGGIHDAVEISRQLTPEAFDANGEILPCALVKTGTENDAQGKINAVQTPLVIYYYERSGYASIDLAMARVYDLLTNQHIAASAIWQVRFNSEIARTTDEALYCSLAVQRYNVIRRKS